MKNLFLSAAILAAATALPASADATVTINSIDGNPSQLEGQIAMPGNSYAQYVSIGRFALGGTDNGAAANYLTYCIDIFHELHTGNFELAPVSTLVSGATTQTRLLSLLSNADPLIASSSGLQQQTIGAAIQLAVWEMAYETSPTYGFSTGSFQSSIGTTDAARTLAMTYMNNVIDGTWTPVAGKQLQLLYSADNQSQLFLSAAVPEPASWAMMLGGFGLLGGALRMRRSNVRYQTA